MNTQPNPTPEQVAAQLAAYVKNTEAAKCHCCGAKVESYEGIVIFFWDDAEFEKSGYGIFSRVYAAGHYIPA